MLVFFLVSTRTITACDTRKTTLLPSAAKKATKAASYVDVLSDSMIRW